MATPSRGRARLRRSLLWMAGVTGFWAIVALATGGLVVDWGVLHFSARSPARPAAMAIAAVALWILLDVAETADRFTRLRDAVSRLPPIARPPYRTAAIVLAIATTVLGWTRGSMSAGGADPYGYVSQARLWAAGQLKIPQPIVAELPWSNAADVMAPLGYRPTPDKTAIVPTYSPGLPIVMAIFERAAGPEAVYKVVPLLGGVAVFAAFLLGSALAGEGAGLVTAILLATSPVFVYWLMWPMSDVPVTAWWTLALVLAAMNGPLSALAGGAAAGVAILTRPNLVVLGLVPGVWLIWRALRTPPERRRAAMVRVVLFAAGAVPFCVGIAVLFQYWYGSPFESGYGAPGELFSVTNIVANLERYPVWLLSAETPIVVLGVAAPFLLTRRGAREAASLAWMFAAFTLATFAAYLIYAPFNEWWYLRFVLLAFPALLALTSVVLIDVIGRVLPALRRLAIAAAVLLLAIHGLRYSDMYDVRAGERKFAAVGEYVGSHLPRNAIVLSMHHSGSVRLYGGRPTARYDLVPEGHLDEALDLFRRLGYVPYLVIEPWEIAPYHARFPTDRAGTLNWAPLASYNNGEVRIYDYGDAGRGGSANEHGVAVIP